LKIITEKFSKFSNLVRMANENQVYLDFKESVFRITSDNFIAEVQFQHTVDPDKVDNFYVAGKELLALCAIFEELKVKENKAFCVGNNEYNLYSFSGSDFFYYINFDFDNAKKFSLSSEGIQKMIKGLEFAGDESARNYGGVRFYKNKIVSTDGTCLYEAVLNSDQEIDYHADFNRSVVSVIKALPFRELQIYFNKDKKQLFICDENKEIKIQFVEYLELKIPENLDSDDIINLYTHDKFIHIKKDSFLENLEFVGQFVYNEVNERVYIEAIDEKHILIKSDDDAYTRIKHVVNVEKIDEDQIGYGFWIARRSFYEAINVIDDSDILIQIDLTDKDKNAYNIIGLTNKEIHVALSKFKDY